MLVQMARRRCFELKWEAQGQRVLGWRGTEDRRAPRRRHGSYGRRRLSGEAGCAWCGSCWVGSGAAAWGRRAENPVDRGGWRPPPSARPCTCAGRGGRGAHCARGGCPARESLRSPGLGAGLRLPPGSVFHLQLQRVTHEYWPPPEARPTAFPSG